MSHDPHSIYQSLLLGDLGTLEIERTAYTKKFWKRFLIITAVVIGASAIALFIAKPNPLPVIGIIAAVGLIGGGIWLGTVHSRFKKSFRLKFKAQVIPTVVKAVDERLHYDPNRGLMTDYHSSNLFPQRIDRQRAEDTISGQFEETAFAFGEIHTEYKTVSTDSKGRRQEHWHTIFQGLFFAADFNKHFSGQTIIDQDNMERMFGKLGRKFQSWNGTRAGKLMHMDNPAFEKAFATYSTDEQECRYILSPSLMERILKINERTDRKICISFRNSSVYVAYTFSRDLFEPRVFSQSLKVEDVALLTDLVALMIGLVEDLNLNTRIWTKA